MPTKRKQVKKKPVRHTQATDECDGFDGQWTKLYGKPFRWSGRKTPA